MRPVNDFNTITHIRRKCPSALVTDTFEPEENDDAIMGFIIFKDRLNT